MIQERRIGQSEPASLTGGDVRILELMRDGYTKNKEIAAQLSVSVSTVSRHLSGIYKTLGARNRVNAVVEAYRQGIIQF